MGERDLWGIFFESLGLESLDGGPISDDVREAIEEEAGGSGEPIELIRDLRALDLNNPEVRDNLETLTSEQTGAIRRELLEVFAMMLVRSRSEQEMMEELKECLSPGHYRAVMLARQAVRLEDSGKYRESTILNERIKKRYGEDGRRIYNWVRSGFLKSWIWPQLRIKKFFTNTWKPDFKEFWKDQLSYFEQAIWCGREMTGSDLHAEIDERLMGRELPEIKVYGRGKSGVEKVLGITEWFEDVHTNVKLDVDEHELGNTDAVELTISKINRQEPVEHTDDFSGE